MFSFVLFFANLVLISYGSCPYMLHSLKQSNNLYTNVLGFDYTLDVINDFVVNPPQPASTFYHSYHFDPDVVNIFQNSSVLLLAEQFYTQKYLSNTNGPHLSTDEKLDELRSLTECVPKEMRCKPEPTCNPKARYRSIDGSCNNLQRPNDGASHTQYSRLLQAVYSDGLYEERRTVVTSAILSSPRYIGNLIYKFSAYPAWPKKIFNIGGVIFGQMLAHDCGSYTSTEPAPGTYLPSCCSADCTTRLPRLLSFSECIPMDIPRNDPFFSQYNMTCMELLRAQPIHQSNCELGQAQKVSLTTSYLDASPIYGYMPNKAKSLRSFTDGKLKTDAANILYQTRNCTENTLFCYLVGDLRQSNNAILLLQQSIFVRLHNFLATQLSVINPLWNDETLYQEARRILIAIYQHIVIHEWLKIIIGDQQYNQSFSCDNTLGYCGKYDENINPGTFGEFSTAALRFFHALIPNWFDLRSNATTIYKKIIMSDLLANNYILEPEYLGILQGSLYQQAWLNDFPSQLRNHAFKEYDSEIGMDVSSVDIGRARDFGIAPYYQYIEFCDPNAPKINTWDDLKTNIAPEYIAELEKVYEDVQDVDINVGIYLENKDKEGYLGPVGKCIFTEQFHRYVNGDRFFYSHRDNPYPFTSEQLGIINEINYARIICQVIDVIEVPENAFLVLSSSNQLVKCNQFSDINLNAWKDKE